MKHTKAMFEFFALSPLYKIQGSKLSFYVLVYFSDEVNSVIVNLTVKTDETGYTSIDFDKRRCFIYRGKVSRPTKSSLHLTPHITYNFNNIQLHTY